jgi:hypothetical protein
MISAPQFPDKAGGEEAAQAELVVQATSPFNGMWRKRDRQQET